MKSMREWTTLRIVLLIAIVGVCGLTRFIGLGEKPIMHDESLFVYYTEFHLHRDWGYQYQPILHGPAMLWIQAAVFHVFGASDYSMRLGAALLGFFGLFWIWSIRPWLGRWGVYVAMAFYALSPCMMFYQRFFRNDPLFLFTTLWIVASALHWWRSRKPSWAISFVLANTVLFCNKENCLFVYFAMATYFLLWMLHDWFKAILEEPHLSKRPLPISEPLTSIASISIIALLIFSAVTLFLTQVLEGIHYDADVVQAIGRDFPLRDVRSVELALGLTARPAGAGMLGSPWLWRAFYLLLAAASVLIGTGLYFANRNWWGTNSFIADTWATVVRSRYYLIAAMAMGLVIYLMLYTTMFKYPKGPFQLYHETLAYWIGQNAQHRIKGPFHMHLVNMLVYQLPEVLIVVALWCYTSFRLAWTRTHGVALLLVAFAFAAFHLLFFAGLDRYSMDYFGFLAVWTALLALLLIARPNLGRAFFPAALAVFFVFSAIYFHSRSWRVFANEFVQVRGDELALTGREFLDEKLSLTSGFHLFLIAYLIIVATVIAWNALDRRRHAFGFFVWWLVIMAGASSYAREKVPWVGIHIAVPLILLSGVIFQQAWDRISPSRHKGVLQTLAIACVSLGLLWNAKAAINLCFVHPGDVRERLVYAETPVDLRNHARLIQRYAEIATIRDANTTRPQKAGDPFISGQEWEVYYNDPSHLRDVRVLVAHEEVVWPLRWYLRDIEWTDQITVQQASEQQYPFIFLTDTKLEENPELRERYHIILGRGRMHWTPEIVDWDALTDIWRATIPLHNRIRQDELERVARSKREWRQLWDYMVHRRIPEEPYMALPTVKYYFAVKKDLPPF